MSSQYLAPKKIKMKYFFVCLEIIHLRFSQYSNFPSHNHTEKYNCFLYYFSAPDSPTSVIVIQRTQRSIDIHVIVPNPETIDSLNITSKGHNVNITTFNKTNALLVGLEPGHSYIFTICSIYQGIESTDFFGFQTETGTHAVLSVTQLMLKLICNFHLEENMSICLNSS